MSYVYFNGQFVRDNKAVINISTHALHYGTGCFEGLRAYWNKDHQQIYIFRGKEHYRRLKNSCKTLVMKLPYSVKELQKLTVKLLIKNKYRQDVYIRPLVYKATSAVAKLDLTQLKDGFALYAIPLGHYLDTSKGISVGVSSWCRGEANAIPPTAKPTGLYLNTCLAKTEAIQNGFDEAIFLNQDGSVSEGSAMNLFLVQNGKLITPDVSSNILIGVTRQTIIEIAQKELGLEIKERRVSRAELYTSDEAFFTGTAAEVTPVVKIDRRLVGNGKIGSITKKLQKLYFEIVQGENKKYHHWLTPIY